MPFSPKASTICALGFVGFMSSLTAAAAPAAESADSDLSAWLDSEQAIAAAKISSNLLPNGALLASPSRSAPNYYFHWTRDAALTMNVVLDLYSASTTPEERSAYLRQAHSYVDFTIQLQAEPTLSGSLDAHYANLGEPKFEVSGRGFNEPWGRPQTDGPALRASSLIRIYTLSLQRPDALLQFKSSLGSLKSAILKDLEYTAYHWRDQGFDLWEEVRGQHFYNALAQRRALLDGAAFVQAHPGGGDAERYLAEARAIEVHLARFWDGQRGHLMPTINRDGGLDYKNSNLDSSIILAALHAQGEPGYFSAADDRVLATAHFIRSTFASLYPINKVSRDPKQRRLAPAIGRYPEDRYDGNGTSQGHPWFLTTAALAELMYSAAISYDAANQILITAHNEAFFADLALANVTLRRGDSIKRGDTRFLGILLALLQGGDEYLARIHLHAANSGDLTEQFDRYTGFERGARDLSWSYASVLSAAKARARLIAALRL